MKSLIHSLTNGLLTGGIVYLWDQKIQSGWQVFWAVVIVMIAYINGAVREKARHDY